MKKILFVMLNDINMVDYSGEWVGVAYISTCLKKQNLVDVQFCICAKEDMQAVIDKCEKIQPNYIGFPVLTFNFFDVKKCVDAIKKRYPNIFITLGHREATKLRGRILEEIAADACMVGEGEITFPELIQALEDKQPLNNVKGLCFRDKDGNIIENEPRPDICELDSIPFPDRSIVAENGKYHHHVNYVITTRGCRGNCSFCDIASDLHRRKMIYARSIENIMDEIEDIIATKESPYIAFGDDSFEDGNPVKNMRYEELYQQIISRNLEFNFSFNARAESITAESIPYLKKLQTVGLDKIFIGIDSGNVEDLRLYRKRATLDNNKCAASLLYENSIPFDFGFIMFNPYTTFEKLKENIDFLEKYKFEIKSHVLAHRFVLYTGAPMMKNIESDDLLDIKKFEERDPFCYRFKNESIQEVWEILHQFRDWPVNRDTITMVAGFLNSLKRYEGIENSYVQQFDTAYKDFVDTSRTVFVKLFRYVIKQSEEKVDISFESVKEVLKSDLNLVQEKWDCLYKINIKNGVRKERSKRKQK